MGQIFDELHRHVGLQNFFIFHLLLLLTCNIIRIMANIKSAKKRINVNRKKNEQNRAQKSELNTAIKKFKAAPTADGYSGIVSLIDKAAAENVFHKNKANRLKARFAMMVEAK
jgi:small subunit ribosomal protein S20